MPVAVGVMADSYKAPVSSFDPLSITWHSAFWASDPGWTPPADGAAVTSWRNAGTSAANATQATGANQPTYRASYANLNGKPAVQFDGATDRLETFSGTDLLQPNHIVVVGWLDPTVGSSPTLCDSGPSGGGRHLVRNQPNGDVLLYAGAVATVTGAGRLNQFVMAALFNVASSALRMNGTAYTPGTVGNAEGFGYSMSLGNDPAGGFGFKGAIAFFGLSGTALTAQNVTDLETWAKNYYGVPIP